MKTFKIFIDNINYNHLTDYDDYNDMFKKVNNSISLSSLIGLWDWGKQGGEP